MVINSYQLCSILRKASGYSGTESLHADPSVFLEAICNDGFVRLPFEPDGVFWVPERIPVFSDIQLKLERSRLLSQLSMRSEDTGLVVDSLRRGGDAVYFATLTKKWSTVTAWVDKTNQVTAGLTVKAIDDEYVLVLATFRSFVVTHGVG